MTIETTYDIDQWVYASNASLTTSGAVSDMTIFITNEGTVINYIVNDVAFAQGEVSATKEGLKVIIGEQITTLADAQIVNKEAVIDSLPES